MLRHLWQVCRRSFSGMKAASRVPSMTPTRGAPIFPPPFWFLAVPALLTLVAAPTQAATVLRPANISEWQYYQEDCGPSNGPFATEKEAIDHGASERPGWGIIAVQDWADT